MPRQSPSSYIRRDQFGWQYCPCPSPFNDQAAVARCPQGPALQVMAVVAPGPAPARAGGCGGRRCRPPARMAARRRGTAPQSARCKFTPRLPSNLADYQSINLRNKFPETLDIKVSLHWGQGAADACTVAPCSPDACRSLTCLQAWLPSSLAHRVTCAAVPPAEAWRQQPLCRPLQPPHVCLAPGAGWQPDQRVCPLPASRPGTSGGHTASCCRHAGARAMLTLRAMTHRPSKACTFKCCAPAAGRAAQDAAAGRAHDQQPAGRQPIRDVPRVALQP